MVLYHKSTLAYPPLGYDFCFAHFGVNYRYIRLTNFAFAHSFSTNWGEWRGEMSDPLASTEYTPSTIRTFLRTVFDEPDLAAFCYDYFPPVYQRFRVDMTLPAKVSLLTAHCQNHNSLDELLAQVQTFTPHKYAEFAHLLQETSQPSPDHRVSNRFRNIAIGVIALLLVISVGLFVRITPTAHPPDLTVERLWYTLNDETEQFIERGSFIEVESEDQLCLSRLIYRANGQTTPQDGAWGEAYLYKGDIDFDDGRIWDGRGQSVSQGFNELQTFIPNQKDACWKLEEGWDRLVIYLYHQYGTDYEIDDQFFVELRSK